MRHRPNRRDLHAGLLAAAVTLVIVLLEGPGAQFERILASPGGPNEPEEAMQGLIEAEQAESTGAFLLDEDQTEAKLSFAPEHERLVWRVEGDRAEVVIDARTGETLEFEFELD